MRNFSKNKFLLCFRPVVDIDAMLESEVSPNRSDSCSFPRIPVSNKQEMTKFSESWIMQHPPKRTVSRVIKAVVFGTMLKRRVRNKIHFGSKRSYLAYTEIKAPRSPLSTSSSNDSSSSSSSVSPQASESKKFTEEKHKEVNHRVPLENQKRLEWNGIYIMVLISLAFTMFWGKLFGIILTSTWLYFFFSICNTSQKRLPSCSARERKYHYGKCREPLYHNGINVH